MLLFLFDGFDRYDFQFVQRAFEKLDKDKSGNITVEDLHGVYDVTQHPKVVSGEWTEDEALGAFLGKAHTGIV